MLEQTGMKLLSLAVALSLAACSKVSTPEPAAGSGSAVDRDEPGSILDAVSSTEHRVGPRAQRFASYKEDKEGKPCPTYAPGEEVRFGDFSYRFGAPMFADPERRLPWIANSEERAALSRKGAKVMIIPISVRNNAPVAQASSNGIMFFTNDGKWHYAWPYNERLWLKANHRQSWPSSLEPDLWYETAAIYDIGPGQEQEAVLYLLHRTTVRDRYGRRLQYIDSHAVVELARATPTEPIRGGR